MALVRLDEFTTRYPEFKDLACGENKGLVLAVLAEAELFIDATIYGAKTKVAILAKAAALLSLSECAGAAGLVNSDKKNPYLEAWNNLSEVFRLGFQVV